MKKPEKNSAALLCLMSLFVLTMPVHADEAERPAGGWRVTSSDVADYMQEVNYPAVRVNAGGKSSAALISGKIRTHAKNASGTSRVPLLVVNGSALPMPLEGEDYARPFAFGSGSNSLEVRDHSGKVVRRTQFYEGNPNKRSPRLRVILAWDTDHTDVDLHVVTPSGEHAWYGERVIPSGGALDIDVTDGYGPEIFSSVAPETGTYLVYANYYGGESEQAITEADVTVVQHENTLKEKRQNFRVPLRQPGELNFVNSFIFQK